MNSQENEQLKQGSIFGRIEKDSDIDVDNQLTQRRAKRTRKQLEKGEMKKHQQEPCGDPNFQQCQFLVMKKNRLCRQRALKGFDYCGEHLMTSDQKDADHARVPCPFDLSHSCYKHLLSAHLKKCNAREKALPPYLVKNINGEDVPPSEQKVSVHSVSDEELVAMILRIEAIYKDHVSAAVPYEGHCHPLVEEELARFKNCATVEKHLRQQGHLVQLLCKNNLVDEDQLFVEFGAGRGQLATWIMRALGDDRIRRSAFVLVDRGSQRYKADNRFVEEWGPFIHRVRADIRHLCLERLEPFAQHSGKVVGFCKHLCGVAIDLALRCVTGTVGQNRLPKGMANRLVILEAVICLCSRGAKVCCVSVCTCTHKR
ncbi:tRNA guanosine-2'-O-methyltransferase TRM13-like [Tropilaelaps mercedesae]|uniref:tRNA:m(4)X modification enzyme TRM13 n=1 Tax=Tropilaelaps mercedesae TaxID=418985 RepID=A0A1V9X6B3_9ACAR|nr:tRNA guanosine-2'-O-methyltransferase TRM13-like [Tropilaelaps mercedesae]